MRRSNFWKTFLDAKLNPKTMLEKHLKSLTPEGFLNNLKYPLDVAMNPIEAIKNDPLVKLVGQFMSWLRAN